MELENPTCKNLLASCNSQWCWKRCPPHTLQYILWNLSVVASCSLVESMGFECCSLMLLMGIYGTSELWTRITQWRLRNLRAMVPYSSTESTVFHNCGPILPSGVYETWELRLLNPQQRLRDLRDVALCSSLEPTGLESYYYHTPQWSLWDERNNNLSTIF